MVLPGAAQKLAHPGESGRRRAGSALVADPWWPRAVFYRLDVTRFQASGDGHVGDLAGITQRLDYLQSLGIEALVLDLPAPLSESAESAESAATSVEPARSAAPRPDPYGSSALPDRNTPFPTSSTSLALEDLIREASRRHLRVLLTVTPGLARLDRPTLLQVVHGWLTAGAAGVAVPRPKAMPDSAYADLTAALANLLRLMPGDRILLSEPASGRSASGTPAAAPIPTELRSAQAPRTQAPRTQAPRFRTPHLAPIGGTNTLLFADPLPLTRRPGGAAAELRLALSADLPTQAASSPAILRLAATPPTASPNALAFAAALLAWRGPLLFDFGAEIGLNTGPSSPTPPHIPSDTASPSAPNLTAAPDSGDPSAPLPVMQWTPGNVAIAPIERVEPPPPPAPGQPTPLGAYRPFVRPPPPGLTGAVPAGPAVVVDGNLPPPPPDPDTLPGFSTGTPPVPPVDGPAVNVATEERLPGSILNAYRALLALHHGNAALRDGSPALLNHDAEDALVFIRRAPAASRTVGSVVVAANFSDTPLVLSLDAELTPLGLRPGPLRALFSYGPQPLTGERTGALRLPPHAVFVGEFPHAGSKQ